MEIKIVYHNPELQKFEHIAVGDWIDLRASEDMELKAGDFALIPLGVSMKLPDGYEAHVAPRSSTFKTWGVLMTNSVGVVDNSYSGTNDVWKMPVYATRDTTIRVNDRVCQFRILPKMPHVEFTEVHELAAQNRGGFGSTGTN